MKHIVGTANRRISNKKYRMMKCGIASGFAFGYDPTGRSDYFRLIYIDRIPYFDIPYSLFDIRYSLFQLPVQAPADGVRGGGCESRLLVIGISVAICGPPRY
jgi:hypothetical protein